MDYELYHMDLGRPQIWLAAVKLEVENGELEVARELLIRARTVADTQQVKFSLLYVYFLVQ